MITKRSMMVFNVMVSMVMVLILAACGGKVSNNLAGTPGTPAANSALPTSTIQPTPAKPVDLRLDVVASGTQSIPAYVIKKLELDKKNGFNMIVHENSGAGGANWTAIKTNEVDGIITNWLDIARNRAQTTPVFAIAPLLGWSNGLLVPADSKIASVTDLKDLKLGVYNTKSLDWIFIRAAAEKAGGFDPNSKNKVTEGAPGLLVGLLEQKKVDGILNYVDMNVKLAGTGAYKVVFTTADIMKDLGMNPEAPFLYYGFTETFIKKNPDTIKAFIKSYKEAIEYLRTDDKIWSDIAQNKFDIKNEEGIKTLKDSLRVLIKKDLTATSDADTRKMFQWLLDSGNKELLGVNELPKQLFWTGE